MPQKIENTNQSENAGIQSQNPTTTGSFLSPPPFQLKSSSSPPDHPQGKKTPNPNGLPSQLQTGIEQLSGMDMSDVSVTRNSSKPAQMQAHAFAQGNQIHLGPGQEKHLPHEAWHVAQQKQGRVSANTSVNNTPVNDETSLENEADKMGEKALQMKTSEPGELASWNPVSQPSTQLKSVVVQRAAIETSGGEWDTSTYRLESGRGGRRGAKIDLEFNPNSQVDSTKVGLIQTARAINNGSVTYIGEPTREAHGIDSSEAIEIDSNTNETDEGTHIDQASHNRNPLYAVEGASSTDTTLTDTDADSRWGQHGWRYNDDTGTEQKQEAKLSDTPTQGNVATNSKNIFEVTALALSGAQEGTYYGSIRWGWETDSSGNHTKLPLSIVSQGVPSSSFIKASENWNEGQTSANVNTLDIPIVDVMIASRTIFQKLPDDFVGPPLPIAQGTRVQILSDGGEDGDSRIKIVDGRFTGHEVSISASDRSTLNDERD